MKIYFNATFSGTNSLGYERGKTYKLTTDNENYMNIVREDGSGKCQYGSIHAFLNNWTNIVVKIIDKKEEK